MLPDLSKKSLFEIIEGQSNIYILYMFRGLILYKDVVLPV